jgi:hypothetical protein
VKVTHIESAPEMIKILEMNRPSIAILIFVTYQVSFSLKLKGDQETLDRFLNEAPKAWSAARKEFSEMELSFTTEAYEIASGNKVPRLFVEGKIRQHDLCFRVDGVSYPPSRESDPASYWVIGNPYYVATLARQDHGANAVFVVQALKPRNEKFPDKSNREVFNWRLHPRLYPGYQFFSDCLFDCFVDLEGCFNSNSMLYLRVVDATSKLDLNGREVVILSLKEVVKTENGLEELSFTSVEMKLLPNKNWALLEYNRKSEGKIAGSPDPDNVLVTFHSTTCHYTDDFFFPTKVTEETRMGTHSTYKESKFGPSVPSSLKCNDCRLPAFGLTEPKDLVPRNDLVKYVWVFLGLIAVLGVVFYFRKTK